MSDAAEIPPEELLDPGTILVDRYRVDRVLGRGGMGVVYAGTHLRLGRAIAIKVLGAGWSRRSVFRRRFEAEARAAGAAGHPNIIEVLDIGELPDGRLFSVMERVDGVDLYSLANAEGPLAIDRVVHLLAEIAYGLRAAHRCGIVHRDLKAENVMVRSLPEGEVVKILDFGIAAGVTAPGPDGKRMTRPGMAIGTPEYMAPEQVDGDDPSPRFDIYAFGVVAFELLTGRLPIEDDVPMRLMARKCNEPARRVDEFRPDVPAVLVQLIDDCLQIDPEGRPQSMDEVLARLEPIAPRVTGPAIAPARPAAKAPAAPPTIHATPPLPAPGDRRQRALVMGSVLVAAGLALAAWVAKRVDVPGEGSQASDLAPASTAPAATPNADAPTAKAAVTDLAVEPAPKPTPASRSSGDRASDPAPGGERPAAPVLVAAETGGTSARESAPTASGGPDTDPRGAVGSAHCAAVRARADDARRAHDWEGMLRAAREDACWKSRARRTKALTQAYMELGRFGECARAGRRSKDPDVERWVSLCERRAG